MLFMYLIICWWLINWRLLPNWRLFLQVSAILTGPCSLPRAGAWWDLPFRVGASVTVVFRSWHLAPQAPTPSPLWWTRSFGCRTCVVHVSTVAETLTCFLYFDQLVFSCNGLHLMQRSSLDDGWELYLSVSVGGWMFPMWLEATLAQESDSCRFSS